MPIESFDDLIGLFRPIAYKETQLRKSEPPEERLSLKVYPPTRFSWTQLSLYSSVCQLPI